MAVFNARYQSFVGRLWRGEFDWENDDLRLVLVDDDYTLNLETHETLADIPAAARIETGIALAGRVVLASGAIDADDLSGDGTGGIDGIPAGELIRAAVCYTHDGVDLEASLLNLWIGVAVGLPVATNGARLDIRWNDGPNRIWRDLLVAV